MMVATEGGARAKAMEARWGALLERIGSGAGGSWPVIAARYGEPARAYHNLDHIHRCFALLDAAPGVPDRDAVEAALWIHDLVYDPARRDNEEASARVGGALLRAHGVPSPLVERVQALVWATGHGRPPAEGAASWITDIDLSILGEDPAVFSEYDSAIRREYAWMPGGEFREGRKAVLESLLARQPLFRTTWFQRRYEENARRNLRAALAALDGTP